MRATALIEPGPVDRPLTEAEAPPADWSTTKAHPHTTWTKPRGTVNPFGAPTDSTPSNTTVHRFVGRWDKEYDTTTGLILMGARPYDPSTGRFLSVDPIPGGSLNNYDYAGQDPINNYDLDGNCALCIVAAISGDTLEIPGVDIISGGILLGIGAYECAQHCGSILHASTGERIRAGLALGGVVGGFILGTPGFSQKWTNLGKELDKIGQVLEEDLKKVEQKEEQKKKKK